MAAENDIVLVHFEDKPLFFARIEAISPDMKKDWYHVKLLVLQVPVQTITWILRDIYINGSEFTMNGRKMRLEKVVVPADEEMPEAPEKESPVQTGPAMPNHEKGTVISFDRRKPKP